MQQFNFHFIPCNTKFLLVDVMPTYKPNEQKSISSLHTLIAYKTYTSSTKAMISGQN